MKIVILALIAVAFNVTMAAPSDKGGNDVMEYETSKAQLDMILEQMKDLHHQLDQHKHLISEQQHRMSELMEEQQYQKEELKRRDEEQQYQKEEQQHQKEEQQHQKEEQQRQQRQIQEVTEIHRNRRSENDTVQHLKELVLAEIKPMINGLSECAIGTEMFDPIKEWERRMIPYGRNFTRTPEIIVSLSGFYHHGKSLNYFYLMSDVYSQTTTKFDLVMRDAYNSVHWIKATWVACA